MCFLNFCLTIIFIFFFSTNSIAFQNEPDGFRGIRWGTQASTIKGLQNKNTTYSADDDTYTKKKITLQNNCNFIKKWFFQKYGEPNQMSWANFFLERYEWSGKNTNIWLVYMRDQEFTSLTIFSSKYRK